MPPSAYETVSRRMPKRLATMAASDGMSTTDEQALIKKSTCGWRGNAGLPVTSGKVLLLKGTSLVITIHAWQQPAVWPARSHVLPDLVTTSKQRLPPRAPGHQTSSAPP